MFTNVLVPTDGSDGARNALRLGVDVAERTGATVHVLTVVDSRILDNAGHRDDLEAAGAERIREEVDAIGPTDVTVETAVRTGLPDEEIRRYATDNDVDLIAMGRHGRTGIREWLLGGTIESVVRLSDVPVLTVPASDGHWFADDDHRFLVAVDGSPGADAATDVASTLTTAYGGTLYAVSVVGTQTYGPDAGSGYAVDHLEEWAGSAVDAAAAAAESGGVQSVETTVEHGNVHRCLLAYVEDHDVDLVVVGTHGRTGLERYLLGSVAERVLRASPVPVLTVRPPADATD